MSLRVIFRFLFFCLSVVCLPSAAWPQGPVQAPVPPSVNLLNYLDKQHIIWPITGRVTTLKGEPVAGARVVVDVGGGQDAVKVLETNLQGEFSTEYSLEARINKKLSVKLAATKPGYLDAWERADFEATEKIWQVPIMLREQTEDPDLLPQASLIAGLAPRLREAGAREPLPGPARKDFTRGAEEFLNRRDPDAAIPLLAKVVERVPACVECRTLLGLALLDAGSWASAHRQFVAAATIKAPEGAGAKRPEPFLVLGVIETWRQKEKEAVGLFRQALAIDPADPLALQEMGRALILQQNWEGAEQFLGRAIKAGAPTEAHLLRARALLEQGDVEEAEAEMKAYRGGRQPKELPPSGRMVYAQLKDRLQLLASKDVKSVVDLPLAELVRAMPELAGLEPAQSQEQLALILPKVGEGVEAFFRHFPNTISLEEIREEEFGRDGKVHQAFTEKFQYLLLARPEKWGLGLKEYRTKTEEPDNFPAGGLSGFMRTAGFASATVVFFPSYQSGAHFRYLGRQMIDGHPTFVVAFAQRPDKGLVLGRFDVKGTSFPVLFQGVAWVDPDSYKVIRMRADLLKVSPKARLVKQTTEIRFAEVRFKEIPAALWLPREVAVTVHCLGRFFRNRHRYSDFKLFNVRTEERRKTTGLAPRGPENPN